jgi:putative ABC transport system permease protein
MDTLMQNLRFAFRQFAKRPGFTAVAVLMLALGIGVNTTIFSAVNSVLLRPLPYSGAEHVMVVWHSMTNSDRVGLSEPELIDYRAEIRSFEQLAAYHPLDANLVGDAEPERISAARVTANLFTALGSGPALGRTFTADEDLPGGGQVAVLGHALWQRRFGGDPAIIGKTVRVDGKARTVVGVMPPEFKLPGDFRNERPSELWLPLALNPDSLGGRGRHYLHAVARLRPGASAAQANAELGVLTRRWVEQGLVKDERFSAFSVPVRDEVLGDIRPALLILLGAVGFVLLIACANVANLLLIRADERQKEIAVRAALGAGRGRIAGQLFTESLLLAGLGGGLGLLLAEPGLRALVELAPASIPRLDAAALDGRVMLFTAAIALATGVLFGSIPALQASRRDLVAPLREGGRGTSAVGGRQHVRRGLVVSEVALSVVLVIGAGLLIRSFAELRQIELGFEPENVLTLQLALPLTDYPETPGMVAFYRQLVERVEELPGVHSAGAVALLPLVQTIGDWGIDLEGRTRGPDDRFHGFLQIVTPGYFEAMHIPLVQGRPVAHVDHAESPPAVVVNQTMAARYWPGESALGKRLRIRVGDETPWFTVVGVAGDIRHNAVAEEPRPEMYFPHAQLSLALGGTVQAMTLVVRTAPEPLALAAPVREVIRTLDPNLPVANLRSMERVVDQAFAEQRFTMLLLALFALLALVLGAVGIYGVIAYAVSRRTHEIGIRMALGAGAGTIRRMVVRQGVVLVALGVALGLLAALGATRILASLLYGVTTTDPLTFVTVPLLLVVVALIASYLPARRATRVDPMIALRTD